MPSARGSSGEPGTAKTSRPCSPASRAVISEPERRAASTMTTPTESPEISRLRRGKSRARGSQQRHFRDGGAFGEDRLQQIAVLGRIDAVVAAGQHRDGAGRQTRAVRGGVDAAREAGDDAETGSPRSRASRSANLTPAAEALREPTMATSGRVSTASLPRTASNGGASSIICSRGG